MTLFVCLLGHTSDAQENRSISRNLYDRYYGYNSYDMFRPYFISPHIIIPKDSIGYSDLNIEVGTYFQTDFDNYNELGMYVNPLLQGRLSKRIVYSIEPFVSNHNLWLSSSNDFPTMYNGYANFQQIGGSAYLAYELNDHFEVGAGIHGSYAFSNSRQIQNMVKPFHQIGGSVYTRYKRDNFSFTVQFDYTKLPEYPSPIPFREDPNK
ncbi:hypothetical protein K5X82_04775 [Halosquirtibacter xylanolyticus]|uniref:hypothetical protein n=1 Tax=Halosquirtibacter xylanolyticus TaxID=3374599 RepID=UPI0037479B88|nr:hypothetical protein K5X82_04775 [Prolixibacteraceae bacterium]